MEISREINLWCLDEEKFFRKIEFSSSFRRQAAAALQYLSLLYLNLRFIEKFCRAEKWFELGKNAHVTACFKQFSALLSCCGWCRWFGLLLMERTKPHNVSFLAILHDNIQLFFILQRWTRPMSSYATKKKFEKANEQDAIGEQIRLGSKQLANLTRLRAEIKAFARLSSMRIFLAMIYRSQRS